jgi:hypothetical protein
MGLFGKKKKKFEFSKELPKLENKKDNFPDFGESKLPTYEGELKKLKRDTTYNAPVKEMGELRDIQRLIDKNLDSKSGMPNLKLPQRRNNIPASEPISTNQTSKPIFIKLENYKSARDHLNKIKDLTRDAERLLGELNNTREEEDRELGKWKNEIERIKSSLLTIDKKLFEV